MCLPSRARNHSYHAHYSYFFPFCNSAVFSITLIIHYCILFFFSLEYADPLSLCRCGGTVGAILTCPLEVVKTRLQSSSVTLYISEVHLNTVNGPSVNRVTRVSPGPLHCLKWVCMGSRFLIGLLGRGDGQIHVKDSHSYAYYDVTMRWLHILLFNCITFCFSKCLSCVSLHHELVETYIPCRTHGPKLYPKNSLGAM